VLVVSGPAAKATDQEAINKAISRGVEFLHAPNAASTAPSQGQSQPVGLAALTGLTLLACDASPDDEAIRRALAVVRPGAVAEHQTYSLSLAILFLDKLGDPADVPLIESMAVRLLAGQNANGGWTYTCPDISDSEVRRLTAHLQTADGTAKREPPKEDKDADGKHARLTAKDLPKEIQDQIAHLNSTPLLDPGIGDNSNTQFATLALWVARRHGIPVEKALSRVDKRFRTFQNADGGWPYMPSTLPVPVVPRGPIPAGGMEMIGSTATMTCAGLLGLAVAQGSATDAAVEAGKPAPDLTNDRNVKRGLAALATAIGTPAGKDGKIPSVGGKSFYFFWSLERVGVILDLDTIGGKDWYAWGSEILVANQAADGSWSGLYGPTVDTCFALLFLKRANLARDLTATLEGKVADPSEVTLKSGGLGNEVFKGIGNLNSGVESKDKPAHEEPAVKPPKDPAETRPPAPPAEETEGGRMARELAQASAERRDDLMQKYRDGKGVTYTEALAGAIPQLSGDDKRKARDALAERLTRMKPDTLSRYFQDQDAEIRRAAALAAAMKEAKTLIPDLIPMLSDAEPAVAHAAHAALKDLTGEKLGPTEEEWKSWWKNRDK
jgi:hypothetical protein